MTLANTTQFGHSNRLILNKLCYREAKCQGNPMSEHQSCRFKFKSKFVLKKFQPVENRWNRRAGNENLVDPKFRTKNSGKNWPGHGRVGFSNSGKTILSRKRKFDAAKNIDEGWRGSFSCVDAAVSAFIGASQREILADTGNAGK